MRKNMNISMPILAGGILLGLFTAGPAQATTYRVTAAGRDSAVARYSGGHAFWFPGNDLNTQIPVGNSARFMFTNDSGRLNVSDDMTTARLTGTIQGEGNASSVWDVNIMFLLGMDYNTFAHGHTDPNGGTHDGQFKRSLLSDQYIDRGGTVDPATWRYFYMDETQSTLTGAAAGGYQGVTLDLFQRPNGSDYGKYVFQMGQGANGKNLNLGFSGWTGYAPADISGQNGGYQGISDINIDLEPMPSIPEPASLGLILTGLSAIMLNARHRRVEGINRGNP